MLVALGFIGINVVLVGLASFLEQPLAQKVGCLSARRRTASRRPGHGGGGGGT